MKYLKILLVVILILGSILAFWFLLEPEANKLSEIDGSNLTAALENAEAVLYNSGEDYIMVENTDKGLLSSLLKLKISAQEISLDRSEDRDKTNTLVLKNKKQNALSSSLVGVYLHFNSDFSEVWVDNCVKPTLSYRVKDPKKAEELYKAIIFGAIRGKGEQNENTAQKPDEWGITTALEFKNNTEFEIILKHSSNNQTVMGEITTGPDYEIKVVYGEKIMSFGDYMRDVLKRDYTDIMLAWDTVLYHIKPDGELKITGNLAVTYGELPKGDYILYKPVFLTSEDNRSISQIYKIEFSVE